MKRPNGNHDQGTIEMPVTFPDTADPRLIWIDDPTYEIEADLEMPDENGITHVLTLAATLEGQMDDFPENDLGSRICRAALRRAAARLRSNGIITADHPLAALVVLG